MTISIVMDYDEEENIELEMTRQVHMRQFEEKAFRMRTMLVMMLVIVTDMY